VSALTLRQVIERLRAELKDFGSQREVPFHVEQGNGSIGRSVRVEGAWTTGVRGAAVLQLWNHLSGTPAVDARVLLTELEGLVARSPELNRVVVVSAPTEDAPRLTTLGAVTAVGTSGLSHYIDAQVAEPEVITGSLAHVLTRLARFAPDAELRAEVGRYRLPVAGATVEQNRIGAHTGTDAVGVTVGHLIDFAGNSAQRAGRGLLLEGFNTYPLIINGRYRVTGARVVKRYLFSEQEREVNVTLLTAEE